MAEILQNILASEGYYCIVGLKAKAKAKTSFHKDWKEIQTKVDSLLNEDRDVYFACSTFAEPTNRTQQNSLSVKSFFLDIDCGTGKPYPTQREALEALKTFCDATQLPPPTIISSGRGVHIYWVLREHISKETWLPVAKKLKALCKAKGLDADPAITADLARILRVPGTYNYKTDPPSKVSILLNSPELDFYQFEGIVGKIEIAQGPYGDIDSHARNINREDYSFHKILSKTKTGKGCAQIEYAITNQNDAEYNLWRGVLSIAANCEEADTAIHIVSNQHKKYDSVETETKAADLIGKPYRCDTLDGHNKNICDDCPNFGKIRSPLDLGFQRKKDEGGLDPLLPIKPPELPFPYFRVTGGGIYRKNKDENDDDILVSKKDIFLTKRLNDKERGDMALASIVLPKDGLREFLIPLSTMSSKEELRKLLSANGLPLMSKQLDLMMAYLIACTEQQQQKSEVEIMRTQFGWTDEGDKFILGDREIGPTGVRYSPPSPKTESISKWLTKKGDLEIWKGVVQVYDMPDFEPHAFGFFTAFGAPLIKHLGFNGALINLINSSSGTGKSTILKVCNSVYGHPDKLLAQETDTFAHKMNRLGVMSNLPYTIDEITNMHPEAASTLLYNVSQGSGPGRMQSQSNVERKNDTSWSLIALASSNSSVAEKLNLIKQFADGEIMRLLEYRIDRTNNLTKTQAYKLFEGTLFDNYGLAGPIYIEYLVNNLEKTITLAKGIQEHLDSEAKLSSRERFWSAVISCNIAGAHVAKGLGLIDIDVRRVLKWASHDLVETLRQQITDSDIDFVGVLGAFLNANRGNILVIDSIEDGRATTMKPLPVVEPKYELTIRIEPDDHKIFIYSKEIRRYCAKEQIIFKDMTRELKAAGIYEGSTRKRLAKGTTIDSPPVEVHVFDATDTDLIATEFLKELGDAVDDPD